MKKIDVAYSTEKSEYPAEQAGASTIMGTATVFRFKPGPENTDVFNASHPLAGYLSKNDLDGDLVRTFGDGSFLKTGADPGFDFHLAISGSQTALIPGDYYLEVRDETPGQETVLYQRKFTIKPSPKFSPVIPPPAAVIGLALGGTGVNLSAAPNGVLLKSGAVVVVLATNPVGTRVLGEAGGWVAAGSGSGDMTTVVYDTDGDGVLNAGAIPASFATISFVATSISTAIADLVNTAPGALDTLKELADALGDDPNFAATIMASVATKAPLVHTHTENGLVLIDVGTNNTNSLRHGFAPKLSNRNWEGLSGGGVFAHLPSVSWAGIADGATITFDLNTGRKFRVTLGGNRTLAVSNTVDGDRFEIALVQDGTGSRTVTWWANIKWVGGAAPTLTATVGKIDRFLLERISATEWNGFVVGQNI